jgi:probable rRNA maturation factor
MSKLPIHFFSESTSFKPQKITNLRNWINQIITAEKYQLLELNFIFCSDNYLLKINKEFLNHDTYTDIITFDNSEEKEEIAGDIFISIDRVRENAKTFQISTQNELNRVIVHGVLHLLGYKDKIKKDKQEMTDKEDYYLQKVDF